MTRPGAFLLPTTRRTPRLELGAAALVATLGVLASSARAQVAEGQKVRQWADFTLRVADGKGVVLAKRLNGNEPSVDLNIKLRDRSLVIGLDAGVNGPIMDRLELHHAAVLVKTKP